MRPLSDDIVTFIDKRFHPNDKTTIINMLATQALSTPRIQRAVLFLSGGSMSMLRHYVNLASADVREVITRAEYVVGVADQPLPIRSMSEPFANFDELSTASKPDSKAEAETAVTTETKERSTVDQALPAERLAYQKFSLGFTSYVVAAGQTSQSHVRCYRYNGNLVSVVRLPLVFVMERLSERIELSDVSY